MDLKKFLHKNLKVLFKIQIVSSHLFSVLGEDIWKNKSKHSKKKIIIFLSEYINIHSLTNNTIWSVEKPSEIFVVQNIIANYYMLKMINVYM